MIDITKIDVGDSFKDYKHMCSSLGLEIKTGKSKILQLEQIRKFIDLEKDGRSFIVKEIYEKPNLTATIMDLMILSLLYHMKEQYSQGEEVIYLNSSFAIKVMNMVNDNYKKYKHNFSALSEEIGIEKECVEDFYVTSQNAFDKTVSRAMQILKNHKSCSKFSSGDIVVYSSGGGIKYRLSSVKDNKAIINAENKALNEMNIPNEAMTFMFGKYKEYKDRVNEILQEEYDKSIVNYYYGYRITISEEIKEIDTTDLSQLIAITSELMTEKQIENAIKRNQNATKKHEFYRNKYDKVRVAIDYVEKQTKIIHKVIPQ